MKGPRAFQDPSGEAEGGGLVRIPAPPGGLSPKQQRFNQLTEQIEDLQRRIAGRRQELDGLMKEYRRTIPALEAQEAAKARSLALGLDEQAARRKCGRSMRDEVRRCILILLELSLGHQPEDPEAQALFERWAGSGFGGIKAAGEDQVPEDPLPPAWKARQQRAKRTRSDQRATAAELLAQRSVRSVYLGLARILHPDAEPDPALRAGKEQLMKRLTEARDRKDLHTLLQLERTWLHQEQDHLERLPEATLDRYLAFLTAQAAGLEEELRSLPFESAYRLLGPSPKLRALRQAKRELARNCELLDQAAGELPRFGPGYLRELAKLLG